MLPPPPGIEDALISAALAASSLFSMPSPTATLLPTATFASSAIATFSPISPYENPPENGECELLGPFAILVQGSLGIAALMSLVYKRWRERPQRPLKIWSFDVSKQVVGSVLVHIANLLMSLLSSGQLSVAVDASVVARRALSMDGLTAVVARAVDAQGKYKPNPCSFYLLNLAIDTTVGIPILILLLRILTALFSFTPMGKPYESIVSGNYGSPPRATWWLKQSLIYFIGLMGMKVCVLIIFLLAPWISRVGDWALRWTEGDVALQVIFVMLVFPVIMNATQYYIIDTYIQNQNPNHSHEQIPGEDPDESFGAARDPYADPDNTGSDADDESDAEILAKAKERPESSSSRSTKVQIGRKDYDPLIDGENSPVTVIGSASTSRTVPPK